MIIVAALPSADGTAAAKEKDEKQEDGSKGKNRSTRKHAQRELDGSLHISRGFIR
jgi:hypothetical protein